MKFVLVGLLLVIAGCGARATSGYVEDITKVPGHNENYVSGHICFSYDKYGQCSFSVPMYSSQWISDRCYVKINDTEKTHSEATYSIDCSLMYQYKVGDWVEFHENQS